MVPDYYAGTKYVLIVAGSRCCRVGMDTVLFSHAIPFKSMRSRQYFHPVSVVKDQQVLKKTSALVVYLFLVFAACPQ